MLFKIRKTWFAEFKLANNKTRESDFKFSYNHCAIQTIQPKNLRLIFIYLRCRHFQDRQLRHPRLPGRSGTLPIL